MVEDRREEKRNTFCVQSTQFYKHRKMRQCQPLTHSWLICEDHSVNLRLGWNDAIWWYW